MVPVHHVFRAVVLVALGLSVARDAYQGWESFHTALEPTKLGRSTFEPLTEEISSQKLILYLAKWLATQFLPWIMIVQQWNMVYFNPMAMVGASTPHTLPPPASRTTAWPALKTEGDGGKTWTCQHPSQARPSSAGSAEEPACPSSDLSATGLPATAPDHAVPEAMISKPSHTQSRPMDNVLHHDRDSVNLAVIMTNAMVLVVFGVVFLSKYCRDVPNTNKFSQDAMENSCNKESMEISGDSHTGDEVQNASSTAEVSEEPGLSEEVMMNYRAMAVMGGNLLNSEGQDEKDEVQEKTDPSKSFGIPHDREEDAEKENMTSSIEEQTSVNTVFFSSKYTSEGSKKDEVLEKATLSEEVRTPPDRQTDEKDNMTPSNEEQTSAKAAILSQEDTSKEISSHRQGSQAKPFQNEALHIKQTIKTLRCVTSTEPLTPDDQGKAEEKSSQEKLLKESMYQVIHPHRVMLYPLPRDHRPKDMFAPQDRPNVSGHQGAEGGDRHDSGLSHNNGSLDLQDMRNEYSRLASFHTLPPSSLLSSIRMAEAGWHLTGRGDETECFHCRIRHSGWRAEQCPLKVHQELSPRCNFLQHPHGNNVPILNSHVAVLCRQGACRQRDSSSCRTLGAILGSAGAATSRPGNGQREQVAAEAARQSAPRSYIPEVWSGSSPVSSSTQPPSSLPSQPSPSLPSHPPTPSLPQQSPAPSLSHQLPSVSQQPPSVPQLPSSVAQRAPSVPQQPPTPSLPRQPYFPSLPWDSPSLPQEFLSPLFPPLSPSDGVAGRSSPQAPTVRSPPFPSLPVLPILPPPPSLPLLASLPTLPSLPNLPSLPLLPSTDNELFADGPEETEDGGEEERQNGGIGGGDHVTLQSNAIGSPSGQQHNATQEDRTTRNSQHPGGQTQTSGGQGEVRRDSRMADQRSGPSHPGYVSMERRLASFANWASVSSQPPEELARLGFFYAGFGDAVRCHWCGLGLKDWGDDDVPLHEHVRWRSSCEFLRSLVPEREIFAILAQFARQAANEESEDDLTAEELDNMSPADLGVRMPPKPQ